MKENSQLGDEQYQVKINKKMAKPIIVSLAAVVLVVLSFLSGVQYQKGHQSTLPKGVGSMTSYYGRRGGFNGQRPTTGAVTAVSATSISINDQVSGTAKTYAITSATTITTNGQAATTNDIAVGDTAVVIASSTDATQAARIVINPGSSSAAPSATSN